MESNHFNINTASFLVLDVVPPQRSMMPISVSGLNVSRVTYQKAGHETHATMLLMFDEIWEKLLMMAKRLRDVMQSYNAKRQTLGWNLEVNAIKRTRQSIQGSFTAAMLNSSGMMLQGGISLGGGVKGVRCENKVTGKIFHEMCSAGGQSANSVFSMSASAVNRSAEMEKTVADLQNKGAQSYAKTQDELQAQAHEIMQQMMEMGQKLVEGFNQALRYMMR